LRRGGARESLVFAALLLTAGVLQSAPPARSSTQVTAVRVGSGPDAIAVDQVTGNVFVANGLDNTVSVIDGSSNEVVKVVGVGSFPDGIAEDPSSGEVFVANGFDNTVSVIDEATDAVSANITVGDSPLGLAADQGTGMLYVTDSGTANVSVISESEGKVVQNLTVGAEPIAAAVDGTTGVVFIALSFDNKVSVVQATSNAVKANVSVGLFPEAVDVDPSSGVAYVANNGDNSVSVIDEGSDLVTANVTVGSGPDGIAVDPVNHLVYVADLYDDAVSVMDGVSRTIVGRVQVGAAPVAVAVDYSSNTVYVANFNDDTVSVFHGFARATATSLSCSPAPVALGSSTACTASVSGDLQGGTVSFSIGAHGNFSGPGNGTCTVSGGSCAVDWTPGVPLPESQVTVTADYSGDASFAPSSGNLSLAVLKSPTTVSVACLSSSAVAGSPVQCSAEVSGVSPTGTVTWSSSEGSGFARPQCTLDSGSCGVTYIPGGPSSNDTVSAYFSGDANNLASGGHYGLKVSAPFQDFALAGGVIAVAMVVAVGAWLLRRNRKGSARAEP
jgi:YVTN family beta-propeller protein